MESSSRSDEKGPTKPDSTASLPSQSAASEGGSSLPPLPTRSAASEVLLVPELRQRILRHLNRKSLACFMRVDRKFMFDVATELYHTMDYGWVRSHMAMTTERQRTYCMAVRVIDGRGDKLKLAPAMLHQMSLVHDPKAKPRERRDATAEFLSIYRTEVFKLVVPPMLRKCPGLRVMHLGAERRPFGGQSWTVRFDPPGVISNDSLGSGHIDFYETLCAEQRSSLTSVTAVKAPEPPSQNYTISLRFDLSMEEPYVRMGTTRFINKQWSEALGRDPAFGHIHKAVGLGDVEITFADLASLYARQISLGYTERLEVINAPYIAPWAVTDLRSFSVVAGATLTSLDLVTCKAMSRQYETKVDFADLPGILSVVTGHLPLLRTLRIPLNGVQAAEKICGDLLGPDALEDGGRLTTLRIVVTGRNKPIPMLNTLRYVSRACEPTAKVMMTPASLFGDMSDSGSDSDEELQWKGKDQQACYRFLRAQPASFRAHLAVVNFADLGVKRVEEVSKLGCHSDGRPLGLWEERVGALMEEIRSGNMRRGQGESQSPAQAQFEAEMRRMAGMAPSATSEQMLPVVRKAYKLFYDVRGSLSSGARMTLGAGFAGLLRDLKRILGSRDHSDFSGDSSEEDAFFD